VAEATTTQFVVRSLHPQVDAAEFAQHAESRRMELVKLWLPESDSRTDWAPRCEVVIHTSKQSYLRAIGQAASSTSGSTLIRFSEHKVVVRRIDLLATTPRQPFETISHELVHVIFAERFPKTAPPRWAEEGAALLADTVTKRTAHEKDFQTALRNGTAFRVRDLVGMSDYPPPTRFAPFYGQSLVLVDFLTRQGDPGDFLRFVEDSMEHGHDAALDRVYGISGTRELEILWQERVAKVALSR